MANGVHNAGVKQTFVFRYQVTEWHNHVHQIQFKFKRTTGIDLTGRHVSGN